MSTGYRCGMYSHFVGAWASLTLWVIDLYDTLLAKTEAAISSQPPVYSSTTLYLGWNIIVCKQTKLHGHPLLRRNQTESECISGAFFPVVLSIPTKKSWKDVMCLWIWYQALLQIRDSMLQRSPRTEITGMHAISCPCNLAFHQTALFHTKVAGTALNQ